jgi:hypothetical protein
MTLWQFCDRHMVFAGFVVFTAMGLAYDGFTSIRITWRRKP